MLWKSLKRKWWYLAGGLMLGQTLTGCLTQTQTANFLRAEVSRVTGGIVGQLYLIFLQGA